MKRQRQIANPAVTEDGYMRALTTWAKGGDLCQMLGPLVQEGHKVTPAAVVRISGLLDYLVNEGCTNGVVFPSRFESAVRRFPGVKAPDNRGMQVWAADVTDHVRHSFGMLRQCKLDEAGKAKMKKSAAFQRAMTGSDHVVITALLNKMRLTEPADDQRMAESPNRSMARSTSESSLPASTVTELASPATRSPKQLEWRADMGLTELAQLFQDILKCAWLDCQWFFGEN